MKLKDLPVTTVVFEDPAADPKDNVVGYVTLSGARIVTVSQYIDVRDKQDKTICTLTWPTTYRARIV